MVYGEAMEGDNAPRLVSKLLQLVHNPPTPVMSMKHIVSGSKQKQMKIMIRSVIQEGNCYYADT
jgi:hypothetical protein